MISCNQFSISSFSSLILGGCLIFSMALYLCRSSRGRYTCNCSVYLSKGSESSGRGKHYVAWISFLSLAGIRLIHSSISICWTNSSYSTTCFWRFLKLKYWYSESSGMIFNSYFCTSGATGLVPMWLFLMDSIWLPMAFNLLGLNQWLGLDSPKGKQSSTWYLFVIDIDSLETTQIFSLHHVRITVCSTIAGLEWWLATEQAG